MSLVVYCRCHESQISNCLL